MRRTDRPKDKNKNLYIRATPHKGSNKATAESIEKVIFNQSWGHALWALISPLHPSLFMRRAWKLTFFTLTCSPQGGYTI